MPPLDDRGDRPMAMPFVMASSHTMQQTAAGMSPAHLNGSGLSSSTSSPRGAPSWNGAGALEDPSYRTSSSVPPPSGYLGSPHDAHVRSPVQGHRYAASSSSHAAPPLGRMGGNTSSSGIHLQMTSPPPLSGRARPPSVDKDADEDRFRFIIVIGPSSFLVSTGRTYALLRVYMF